MSLQGILILMIVLFISSNTVFSQTRQEHVHNHAHTVMPFDISRSVHIFRMTDFGGIQRVIAKDPKDSVQTDLIREHLRQEAEKFQEGDFSSPATLHGADMPGLRELQAGASRLEVSYTEVPDGAEIRFEGSDIGIITAVHRWFGAQLSEHGDDAIAE